MSEEVPVGSGAVMRCGRGQGLGIPSARELVIRTVDGQLRVSGPESPEHLATTAASVSDARWLSPKQTRRVVLPWYRRYHNVQSWWGSVVISEPSGPVLAFLVFDFVPWAADDQRDARRRSGAEDVVRALGLVLEGVRDADLPSRRDVRRVLVEYLSGSQLVGWLAAAATVVVGVLAFLALPLYDGPFTPVQSVPGWTSLAILAPLTVLVVQQRRRFNELVSSPPAPGDRQVYRPPDNVVGRSWAQLQIGRSEVVVATAGGREVWVNGPAAGGAVTMVRGERDTGLLGSDGAPLLVLRTAHVAPDKAAWGNLAELCARVGIEAVDDPFYAAEPSLAIDLRHDETEPGALMTGPEQGRTGLLVDALLMLAGVLLFFAAGISYLESEWVGWMPIVAGAAVAVAARAWAGMSYLAWRKRVVREQKRVHQ